MDAPNTPHNELPSWVYYGLLLLIVSGFALLNNPADPDLWHRLALGSYFFSHHALPTHDIYSYLSESKPLYDHEWGCGILFYALYHCLGEWSLVALKLAVYIATLYLVDRTARLHRGKRDLPTLTYMALVAMALAPLFVSTTRCLVFTNLFLALWLNWLERGRLGEKIPLWWFMLTSILWANLHGGFVSGLGLIALYAPGEVLNRKPLAATFERYGKIGLCAALATLCNPYTYHLWISTAHAITTPRPDIYEWAAPQLLNFTYFGFKLLAILGGVVGVGLLLARNKNRDWVALLAVGITLLLALRHLRHLALFSILGGVFIYRGLNALKAGWTPFFIAPSMKFGLLKKTAYSSYFIVIVIMFFSLLGHGNRFKLQVNEPGYPVRAVEFLSKRVNPNAQARLLLPFNWGSYALWKLHPATLVSIDGRYELVYNQDVYRAVHDFFYGGRDGDRILQTHPPDLILMPRNAALEEHLGQLHYNIVYQDDTAAIFSR